MIKMVLFDLDGTLLPMDQDVFIKSYFGLLVKKLAPLGYEPKQLVDAVWNGTGAMVKNDGTMKNEDAFWNYFASVFGEESRKDIPVFEEFYAKDFQLVQKSCGHAPEAAGIINALKEAGTRIALATNPLFPAVATESRIRWAGLDKNDFECVTTYENSHYCKPNPKYYLEIIEALGLKPEECLMVGNDVSEDMIAATLGMKVFLLKNCLINSHDKDISGYPQGDYSDLMKFLQKEGLAK